jgi:hypothetical protein
MSLLLKLTEPQLAAYIRYIKARDKVKITLTIKNAKEMHIQWSDVLACVDVVGQNHPAFIQNDEWLNYLAAQKAWREIMPESRKTERMSAIRGDYGKSDNWNTPKKEVKEIK